jgi:hypothetical protein
MRTDTLETLLKYYEGQYSLPSEKFYEGYAERKIYPYISAIDQQIWASTYKQYCATRFREQLDENPID